MSRRPVVGADPVPAVALDPARGKPSSDPPQQIGVTDENSLETLLRNTFYRLNGLISDPQDMIQLMEAEILRLRRGEYRGPSLNIATMEPPDDDPTAGIAVVSHTQDSKECEPQHPPQLPKKYYVRLTLESADEIQPSPVNFPSERLQERLAGPISLPGAQIVFGCLEPFLKTLL